MNRERESDEHKLENPPGFDPIYPDAQDEYNPPRRSILFRLAALFTVLAFTGLITFTYWPGTYTPIMELVSKSQRNKKDIDGQLLQAVVKINVVSREEGSSFAVGQKSGTGFNISSSGLIVTNYHVLQDALTIAVTFPDGKLYGTAQWSGKPEYDLALITLNKANLPTVPLNMTRPPAAGDQVRIVGNPLGLNNIVIKGEVQQYLTVKGQRVFSIAAPIYPGNSGSPVYDRDGKVVGVVFGTLRGDKAKGSDLGLAVPITDILKV